MLRTRVEHYSEPVPKGKWYPQCSMDRYTRLTTIEDAYFFLHCGMSTSFLPSSEVRRQRFLRGAVLVAWIAVEEGVSNQWRENSVPGKQSRELYRKVDLLFKHLGLQAPNWRDFDEHRRTRNRITHPPAGAADVVVTDDQATEILRFCSALLSVLYTDLLVWKEWEMG